MKKYLHFSNIIKTFVNLLHRPFLFVPISFMHIYKTLYKQTIKKFYVQICINIQLPKKYINFIALISTRGVNVNNFIKKK